MQEALGTCEEWEGGLVSVSAVRGREGAACVCVVEKEEKKSFAHGCGVKVIW